MSTLRQYWSQCMPLLITWCAVSALWLLAQASFGYNTSSDIGFHLYNLKQFGEVGLSHYNAQIYWGQEYLVNYPTLAYVLGSAFAWMLPGIFGAILAFKAVVLLSSLCALVSTYWLVDLFTADKRVRYTAAVLYAYSPFVWRSLQHSLPDFLAYALLPLMLWALIRYARAPSVRSGAVAIVTFALLWLASTLNAYFSLLAAGLTLCYIHRSRFWRTVGVVCSTGIGGLLLSAYWSVPFFSYLVKPDYTSSIASFGGVSIIGRYLSGIAYGLTPSTILYDGMSLFSPVARHIFPLVLCLLALPSIVLYRRQDADAKFFWCVFGGIALFAGIFTIGGNILSLGLGILQDHHRWFVIVNLSAAVLAGYSFVTLYDHSRRLRRVAGIAAVVCLVLFMSVILLPYKSAIVETRVAEQEPVVDYLKRDTDTYRLLELPLNYLPYSPLVHGKDNVLGPCQYCNRLPKIAAAIALDPYALKTAGFVAQKVPPTMAPFLGELNTKYVILYDRQFYPDLGITAVYTASAFESAEGFESVYAVNTTSNGSYWILTFKPNSFVRSQGELVVGDLRPWYARLGSRMICKAASCVNDTFAINISTYGMGTNVDSDHNSATTLYIPAGDHSVVDSVLADLRLLNLLNPFVHISSAQTPVVTTTTILQNTAYRPRIESVTEVNYLANFDDYWNLTEQGFVLRSHASQGEGMYKQAQIANITFGNGWYSFSSSSDERAFIIIREGYLPDWRANVDGKEIPIVEVQPYIMGIVVEPGIHSISLKYENNALWIIGWVITALTICVLVLIIVLEKNRSRKRR